MSNYVYKYVYNNEIIYIGKTKNLESRLKQHGKSGDNIPEEGWDEINASDIYYAELADATMSDVIESALIAKYQPKYNRAKKSLWSGLNFIEPVWYFKRPQSEEDLINEINNLEERNNNLAKLYIKLKQENERYKQELINYTKGDPDLEFLVNECANEIIMKRCRKGKERAKQKPGFTEGRPKKFNDTQIANALKLLEHSSYNRVAKLTGISKATLMRAKKNANNENEPISA